MFCVCTLHIKGFNVFLNQFIVSYVVYYSGTVSPIHFRQGGLPWSMGRLMTSATSQGWLELDRKSMSRQESTECTGKHGVHVKSSDYNCNLRLFNKSAAPGSTERLFNFFFLNNIRHRKLTHRTYSARAGTFELLVLIICKEEKQQFHGHLYKYLKDFSGVLASLKYKFRGTKLQ